MQTGQQHLPDAEMHLVLEHKRIEFTLGSASRKQEVGFFCIVLCTGLGPPKGHGGPLGLMSPRQSIHSTSGRAR